MKALILAAGRGTRLGIEPDRPKCLATVGGRTLLDRYLDTLEALEVPVSIVVGHGADAIRAHMSTRRTAPAILMNDRYMEGSIVSLAVGLGTLDDDLLLLDGDVAFDPTLLTRLCAATAANALLVEVGSRFTDEQYMAGIRGDRVVQLNRAPADGHDDQGEWVGFARLGAGTVHALRDAVALRIARGEQAGGYEDALASLLTAVPFTCVRTDGAAWVEIDFAADLARARELFSPRE